MIPNINEKNSNAVLLETQEMFQSQGMSIIGEGYKEIATNPVLFESYVDSLCQGVSADHVETPISRSLPKAALPVLLPLQA